MLCTSPDTSDLQLVPNAVYISWYFCLPSTSLHVSQCQNCKEMTIRESRHVHPSVRPSIFVYAVKLVKKDLLSDIPECVWCRGKSLRICTSIINFEVVRWFIFIFTIISYMICTLLALSVSWIWSDHFFLGLPRLLFPYGWHFQAFSGIRFSSIRCKFCRQSFLYFCSYIFRLEPLIFPDERALLT
jgi:hypothetical protein